MTDRRACPSPFRQIKHCRQEKVGIKGVGGKHACRKGFVIGIGQKASCC